MPNHYSFSKAKNLKNPLLVKNKKAFLDNYLKTINELDIEVNSIIATYDSSKHIKHTFMDEIKSAGQNG